MQSQIRYWKNRVERDLLSLLMFATIAAFTGLFINQFLNNSLSLVYQSKEQRIGQAVAILNPRSMPQPSLAPSSTARIPIVHDDVLSLVEFRSFIAKKEGIILDARPAIFYDDSHIPGALNLPRDNFAASYKQLKATLEVSKERPLAVYCSSNSCVDSEMVQKGLILLGYTYVFRFSGGMADWTAAHLPVEHASH